MNFDEKLLDEKYVRNQLEEIIPDYCKVSFKLLDLLLAKIIVDIIRPLQTELRLKVADACQNWSIDRVESYWYYSGRNTKEYVEITYWIGQPSLERKETKRVHSCFTSEDWKRPDWAKNIVQFNESLTDKRTF